MAAPTFVYVWPVTGPSLGGEIRLKINQGMAANASVTIGGNAATIVGNPTDILRVLIPAHAAGAVDIVYTDSNGTFTAVNAYTYVASITRLYLASLNATNAQYNLPRPSVKQCIATVSFGQSMGSSQATVLGPDLPPGTATGPYSAAESRYMNGGTNGQFGGVDGFVTGILAGITNIAAGTWTFATAWDTYVGNNFTNADKLCLYVYRPSTSSVIGVIFDNTGDYIHPDGVPTGWFQRQWLKWTFSGSEVSGIQDGDVLCLEWLCCADATHHPEGTFFYFDGHNIPGNDKENTTLYANTAAYLEAPSNLWDLTQTIDPSSIDSEEAFGTHKVGLNLLPSGISSMEAFGTPTVSTGTGIHEIIPAGIPSAEVMGTPTIFFPAVTIIVENWIQLTLIEVRNMIHRSGSRPLTYYCPNPELAIAILTDMANSLQESDPSSYFGVTYTKIIVAINDFEIERYDLAYTHLQLAIYNAAYIDAGISSQTAMGVPTLIHCVSPVGITSLEAVPSPVLLPGSVEIDLDDNGIDSLAAVGRPQVQPGPKDVSPTGIDTQEAFGLPLVTSQIRPTAITSEEALSEPVITCGPVSIEPVGIASREEVGMPLLGLNITRMIGIESEETFGILTIEPGPVDVLPVTIGSQEEVGEPKLNFGIIPGGIPSEEAVGSPTLNLVISPVGIISKQRVGTPRMRPGPVNIYARAIDSDGTVGNPWVKNPERADIIVLEAKRLEAVELEAGQAEIVLYWDKEVVNV